MKLSIIAISTLMSLSAFASSQTCFEAVNSKHISISTKKRTEVAINARIAMLESQSEDPADSAMYSNTTLKLKVISKRMEFKTTAINSSEHDQKNTYGVECDGGTVKAIFNKDGNLIVNSNRLSGRVKGGGAGCNNGTVIIKNVVFKKAACE